MPKTAKPPKSPTSPAPKSTRAAPPAAVEIRIDRALKRKWDAMSHDIEAARREGASAFDRKWEAAGAVVDHDPPLYLAGGYATAKAFFEKVLGEEERAARRNIRVALYASPVEEDRLGPSKLDAAIDYVEAKNGGPAKSRVPVDFAKLRVPVAGQDGRETPRSLEEATVEQIRAATRKLRKPGAAAPAKKSPVVTAVHKVLAAKALRGVSVRYAGDKLSLGNIPVGSVADLGRALARYTPPAK